MGSSTDELTRVSPPYILNVQESVFESHQKLHALLISDSSNNSISLEVIRLAKSY